MSYGSFESRLEGGVGIYEQHGFVDHEESCSLLVECSALDLAQP